MDKPGISWIKSSFSNSNGNCLEVGKMDGRIAIRDSNLPEFVITCTPEEFKAFLDGVRAGEFNGLTKKKAGIAINIPYGYLSGPS